MTLAKRSAMLPWIGLAILYVVWGSTYLFIRLVVDELPPFAPASVRFVAAGLVMGLLALWRDKARPTARQVFDNAIVGVLLLGFGNGIVMWAETKLPSSITALLVATVPLWITLLEGLAPGGRFTVRGFASTAVGLAGVAILARPGGGEPTSLTAALGLMLGGFSWSLGALYTKTRVNKAPLFTSSALQMLAGGLALAVESLIAGEDWSRFAAASATAWGALLYLAIFGSIVGFTTFAYCLKQPPASTVGTYAYVNPVVALFLGVIFLGESLSSGVIVGATLILGAVVLATRKGHPAPVPAQPLEARRAA